MKVRNFLVSNSSSSSFIVTIAVVRDEEKLKKFEEKIGEKLDRYNYEEICKRYGKGDFFDFLTKPSEEYKDEIFVHEYSKQDFYPEDGDDECEPDYDSVSIDDFSDKDQQLFSATLEDGLEIIDQTYYAGRDG